MQPALEPAEPWAYKTHTHPGNFGYMKRALGKAQSNK